MPAALKLNLFALSRAGLTLTRKLTRSSTRA